MAALRVLFTFVVAASAGLAQSAPTARPKIEVASITPCKQADAPQGRRRWIDGLVAGKIECGMPDRGGADPVGLLGLPGWQAVAS